MDVEFRDAWATDAPDLANICLLADGDTFEFLLQGLSPHADVSNMLEALCRSETTAYSYRYFTVAVSEERVIGGFNAFSSDDFARLDRNLVNEMRSLPGVGPFSMIRWFIRRIRLASRSKAMDLPPNSLILANIAVFPPYRRHGIGTQLVQQVISIARAGPYKGVCLFTWEDRRNVIEIYRREGFRLTKTTPFRYHRRLPHRGRCLMEFPLKAHAREGPPRG
jgi:ribosomal protein S18 acetylase RimI-like enzyme